MTDSDAASLRLAAHESIVNGDYEEAEALLRQVKKATRTASQLRATSIATLLEQYEAEVEDAYEVNATLCAKLAANSKRFDSELTRKEAKIKALEAEVVRLASVAAGTSPRQQHQQSPSPRSAQPNEAARKLKPPPVPDEDLCDSESESYECGDDGSDPEAAEAAGLLSPGPKSPQLERSLSAGRGGVTPLRTLSRVLSSTPEHTPPPAVPARRSKGSSRTAKTAAAANAEHGGPINKKHAGIVTAAATKFQNALRQYTALARNIAQQYVVGRMAVALKIPVAKNICTHHAKFIQELSAITDAERLLELLARTNKTFEDDYGALLPHTCMLGQEVVQQMNGNASDTFLEMYADFVSEAETFIAETWRRQCRVALKDILPVLQEADQEAGLSPSNSVVGLVGEQRQVLQSIHTTSRVMQKALDKAKTDHVCKTIPALQEVLHESRMRLQCENMQYEKPQQESSYRLGFFKRGPSVVDVACYLFDGYFVAIEEANERGVIEALVVPTIGDLTVTIRYKTNALVLESREAFIIHGHETQSPAEQKQSGKREETVGHQFLFTLKPQARMRSATAVSTSSRVSMPSPAVALEMWEKAVTQCTFEQNSNLQLVDQILLWVAAGHLKKITDALKHRGEGLWRIFNTFDSQQQLAIVAAANSGHHDVARYLLDEGANVNLALPSGTTAFLAAADRGDIRMLGLLLSHGADPMAQDSEGRCGLEVLRFNHVGRYVNFYNDVLDEYAADPARVRELKVQFETANVRFDSHMRGFKPSEVPSHFSVALSEAALTPVQGYSNPIPALLVLLRDLFNDAGGPLRDGVFRISPDGAKTDRAKQDLTANVFLSRDCVSRAYSNDVDVLASLIKQYLRDLPDPLVEVEDIVVSPGRKEVVQAVEFWSRMTKKGKLYRETLRFVVDVAADVAANVDQTQMNAQNMGIVFGPNVIRVPQRIAEADPQRAFSASKIANGFFASLVDARLAERARKEAR